LNLTAPNKAVKNVKGIVGTQLFFDKADGRQYVLMKTTEKTAKTAARIYLRSGGFFISYQE
jgi:hypothetical protein